MEIVWSILLGYLLGCMSPSAFFSKIKKVDLRKKGTGNLGATNTMMVMGKGYGVFVMVFDIAKSYIAVKLAQLLFPKVAVAGIIAGGSCVVGHIFPFYLKFKGGKGLASFGGMILALDIVMFSILLPIALLSMFIVNYTFAMPMSAAILFPVIYGLRVKDVLSIVIAVIISAIIFCVHIANVRRVMRGEDVKVRQFVKRHLFG